jgi:hypothetical protein
MKRNCDCCSKEYDADLRNLKRGWGLCCSKSCAAKKREKAKPNYDAKRVEINNVRRANWNNTKVNHIEPPNVIGSSGKVTGVTSEGYRIAGGVAYDEWDDPVYNVDPYEDDDMSWDAHKH